MNKKSIRTTLLLVFILIGFHSFGQKESKGHIVVGVLEYQSLDTVKFSQRTTTFWVNSYKDRFEHDFYFHKNKIAEVRKLNHNTSLKLIFDLEKKTMEKFFSSPKGNYYTIDASLSKKKIDKILKRDDMTPLIKTSDEDKLKSILGFECTKIEYKIENEKYPIIQYSTNQIPYFSDAFEGLENSIPGYPLEIIIVINETIELHYGALSYDPDFDPNDIFNEDLSQYEKLKSKKFDKKISG